MYRLTVAVNKALMHDAFFLNALTYNAIDIKVMMRAWNKQRQRGVGVNKSGTKTSQMNLIIIMARRFSQQYALLQALSLKVLAKALRNTYNSDMYIKMYSGTMGKCIVSILFKILTTGSFSKYHLMALSHSSILAQKVTRK